MLTPIHEVSQRRALRRAVSLDCQVISDDWEGPVPHLATNLSPDGIWLTTMYPLHVGSEVVLSFSPPGSEDELLVYGGVRRVEIKRRQSDPPSAGMGIAFDYLSRTDTELLRDRLVGLPPPLPSRKKARTPRGQMRAADPSAELLWVDSLLTFEEDLGDRVNTFELSERVGLSDDLDFACLGEVLTASRPAYAWKRAS